MSDEWFYENKVSLLTKDCRLRTKDLDKGGTKAEIILVTSVVCLYIHSNKELRFGL